MDWSSGQWSNEQILQMLKLYKQEPCLWDPRTRNYKSRSAHVSAWHRILTKLPFKTTLDEVKKKRNSLMGYYRIHLNRYKKTLSITSGRGVYETSWFAFDLMHSFLSPIYGPKKKKRTLLSTVNNEKEDIVEIKSEPKSDTEDCDNQDEISIEDFKKVDPLIIIEDTPLMKPAFCPEVNAKETDWLTNAAGLIPKQNEKPFVNNKQEMKKMDVQESSNTECVCLKNESCKRGTQRMDEYDHFGFMLASKIRKINSTPDREILMNSIQNLVFETYMKCRANIPNNRSQ